MGYNIRSNEDPREGSEGKRPEIVAGRAPASNVHISTAYVAALAATSRVETESSLAKTSEQRARSAVEQGHYQPSSIVSRRSVEERAEHYGPKAKPHGGSSRISTPQKAGTTLSSAANALAGKLETETARSDDAGSQEVSGIISAGITGHTVFTAAQNASPAIVRTGKNTWDVATAAGAATVSLIHTTRYMKSEFIPFDSPFAPQIFKNTFKELAAQTGLSSTATSRNIVYGITQIKTAQASLKDAAHTVRDGVKWMSTASSRGEVIKTAKEKAKEAGKAAGEKTIQAGKAGAVWTAKRGIPTAARGFEKASMLAAQTLSESEERMVSGIGGSLQLADAGVRTAVFTGRTIRTGAKGVHTTAKAAKRIYNGLDYVYFASHGGLRAAWAAAQQKAGAALAKAGSSAVSLVVNLLRSVGSKVLVPVVLIAACAMGILSIVSAPTAVVGTVFSGHFSMELGDEQYAETEIRTFITDSNNGVGVLASTYINDIYADLQNALKANGGDYDIVRFKASSRAEDEYLEVTREMVQEVFYTEAELADIIQPIFNAVLLKDYSLEATQREAQAVLEELFYKLFRITEVESSEWCGQSLEDGSGEPDPKHGGLCDYIHARENCPNKDEGIHASPTCLDCDRSLCKGHDVPQPDGSTKKEYCLFPAWCKWMCTGYSYCGEHNVCTVTLSMDGTYELLYEYFEKPIEELSSISDRTEEQNSQLEMLKVTYEACYEFIRITMLDFAGGMSLDSLEDIQFIKGTRAGYPAVIDLALSQAGQRGGQPFWHSYGFSHRVEWCACFVEWCMRRTPSTASAYPTIAQTGNNASSSAVARYFQQTGAWASGGYTDLAAGDLIFIDWDGDHQIDHIGMVIGQDGTHVYTVEGNRGDKVITDVYDLNASVIFGYGLMGATAS